MANANTERAPIRPLNLPNSSFRYVTHFRQVSSPFYRWSLSALSPPGLLKQGTHWLIIMKDAGPVWQHVSCTDGMSNARRGGRRELAGRPPGAHHRARGRAILHTPSRGTFRVFRSGSNFPARCTVTTAKAHAEDPMSVMVPMAIASNHGHLGTRFTFQYLQQRPRRRHPPMIPIAPPTSILTVALSSHGVATFLAYNCLQVRRSELQAFLDF